jgi:hypothetical protein
MARDRRARYAPVAEERRVVPAARFERTDIGEGFIWGAVATCLGVLLACALLVLWLYPRSTLDRVLDLPLPVYPEPRLQSDPAADMRNFRARELQRLNGVGWVDKAQGVVHIPIGQAMKQLVQEGIAGWPAPAARDAPSAARGAAPATHDRTEPP